MSRYTKKPLKSQIPRKGEYTYYVRNNINNFPKDEMMIMSIDPGICNLSFRIENINLVTKDRNLILMANCNIKTGENQSVLSPYENATNLLKSCQEEITACSVILIERQLPINYNAVRISQHVLTYLLLNVPEDENYLVIAEVDPQLKSKYLKCPKGLTSSYIKKWAIEKAIEILTEREDHLSLEVINKEKKKDDYSDCVLMIEVYLLQKNII